MQRAIKNSWLKKTILILLGIMLVGAIAVYLIFTEKFEDTQKQTAAYTVNAVDFIKEFQQNDSIANRKYAEKIMVVNGTVAEKETADTTVNIKMVDTLTGSYIIFAFQEQYIKQAKQLNVGQAVSIKGSCSGGIYSKILETEFISFKRCAVNK